ncbi:MAG: hypothetical protein ACI9G6_002223, partial [Limisphaerales bacterium]
KYAHPTSEYLLLALCVGTRSISMHSGLSGNSPACIMHGAIGVMLVQN